MEKNIFSTQIRTLVSASLPQQYQAFLGRDIEPQQLPALDLANIDYTLYDLPTDAFVDITKLNTLFLFKDENKQPRVLLNQLPTEIQEILRDSPLKYDEETKTVDLNYVRKTLVLLGKKELLKSLKSKEIIAASWNKEKKPMVQVQAFKYLSKELKAAWCAIFVLKKYFLPEIHSPAEFERARDEMLHIKDYIFSRVLNLNEQSMEFRNLKPSSFIFKNKEQLFEKANTYFEEIGNNTTLIPPQNTQVVATATIEKNKYYLVQLMNSAALDFESKKMGHCIGNGAYDGPLMRGDIVLYSVRDGKGNPHATIEVDTKTREINQIQGHGNKLIPPKYHQVILDLIRNCNINNADEIKIKPSFFESVPVIEQQGEKKALFTLSATELQEALNDRKTLFYPNAIKKELFSIIHDEEIFAKEATARFALHNPLLLKNLHILSFYSNSFLPEELKGLTNAEHEMTLIIKGPPRIKDLFLQQLEKIPVKTLNLFGVLKRVNGISPLAKNTTVQSLILSENELTFADIEILAQHKTVTTLELEKCALKDTQITVLAENKNLINLVLSSNKITDIGAKALAENKNLRNLNLFWNTVTDTGVKALAENNTLRSLDLSYNAITDIGAKALANNSTLKTLSLSSNPIGDNGALAFAQNRSLRCLTVAECTIGERGIQALAQNTYLEELNLSYNAVTPTGARALAENKNLTALTLQQTGLTDTEIQELAQNKTLTALSLSNNPQITSVEPIKQALKNGNCNLLYLQTDTVDFEIEEYLSKNKQNAEAISEKLLSGKFVPLHEISKRQNAIMAVATEYLSEDEREKKRQKVQSAIQRNIVLAQQNSLLR